MGKIILPIIALVLANASYATTTVGAMPNGDMKLEKAKEEILNLGFKKDKDFLGFNSKGEKDKDYFENKVKNIKNEKDLLKVFEEAARTRNKVIASEKTDDEIYISYARKQDKQQSNGSKDKVKTYIKDIKNKLSARKRRQLERYEKIIKDVSLSPEKRIEAKNAKNKIIADKLKEDNVVSIDMKELAKYAIGNFDFPSSKYEELKKKIENGSGNINSKEYKAIVDEARRYNSLDLEYKTLGSLISLKAELNGKKTELDNKIKKSNEEFVKKQKEAKTIEDAEKAYDEYVDKIASELSELNLTKEEIISFTKKIGASLNYVRVNKIADAFYYKNNNIFDSYNDDIFFDLKLGGDVSNSNFLSSLTLGGTYKLKKANVKLGGFVQYDYQTSHNIALGTSVVYDNFLGFVRYRLATYDKLLNHNLDVFGKYYYEFSFDKIKVIPTVSLYTTISSKANVERNIDISPRFGFDLNLGTKVSYDILNNLSLFTEPTITVSYNDQRVNGVVIDRSYFGYDINFGVEYKKSGISVKPMLRLSGDMLGNVSLNSNIGIGYSF